MTAVVVPDRVRTRLSRTTFAGVAFGTTALFAIFTAGPLITVELTGSRAWAGAPAALGVLGTALGAAALSNVMARRGRTPGLVLGWAAGVLGAVIGILATRAGVFPLFLGAAFLLGTGHASNQLARFAAADMHPPERRASVLGWIVWAGTIGAALGPALLRAGTPVADALGLPASAGVLVYVLVAYGAAVVCGLALRPDPGSLADRDEGASDRGTVAPWHLPRVQIAAATLVTSQLTMILIMTITPVHLGDAHHGLGSIGLVMSAHFIGMFGLAPVAGRLSERWGARSMAVVGLLTEAAAAIALMTAPSSAGAAFAVALFLLGFGWSLTFVAGSALLTRGFAYGVRVRLQGRVDALVWVSAAAGSLSSGAILGLSGYVAVCVVGAVLLLPALAFSFWAQRGPEAAPAG